MPVPSTSTYHRSPYTSTKTNPAERRPNGGVRTAAAWRIARQTGDAPHPAGGPDPDHPAQRRAGTPAGCAGGRRVVGVWSGCNRAVER
jgi:hypothetical protein